MPVDVLAALQAANGNGQAQQPGSNGGPIDVLAALKYAGQEDQPAPPAPPPTSMQSFAQGIADPLYGLGRIAQHVAGPVVNATRSAISSGLNAAGQPEAATLFAPVSTPEFDNMVSTREQQYDRSRAAAGQNGIDWWRIAGNAANPVNYMGPSAVPGTVAGRIAQAAFQGAGVGAAQSAGTSQVPGQMWWDAAKGAALGAGTGGVLGASIEGVLPALRFGMNKVRQMVSNGNVPSSAAADQVVKSALESAGHNPSSVDLNLLKGMRQDVQSALDHGADISPAAIVNRAKAESLPIPIQLTRGQATGDPMLYAREQNLRGIQGVGEPITTRLQQQNSGFIANLDALGAKNALDPVSFGQKYSDSIQNFWNSLDAHKNSLYSAVRNSQGQSAAMDGYASAENIKAALNNPQASYVYDMLPSNIRRTIDDLGSGQVPFSVAQMQSLDKIWGDAARGTDGSTAYAINQARRILANAPLADDAGEESRQAYFAARQAHAQQMSLIDPKLPNGQPNPAYQPMVKSVVMDGKPPEQLFNQHFMNAAPSAAAKNQSFLSQINPEAAQEVGQTLMGEIKRQALNSASDDRGTISDAVLRSWSNDPVKSARLEAIFPRPAVDIFHNLASTVEAAKKFPVASAVNTSNTGSALLNAGLSMAQNGAISQVVKHLPLVRSVAEGLQAAKVHTGVQQALTPGVSLKSILTATPMQAAVNRTTTRSAIPGAASLVNRQQQQ